MSNALIEKKLKPLRAYFKDNIKEFVMNKPCEVMLETTEGEWRFKKDKLLDLQWFNDFAKIMAAFSEQEFKYNTPLLSFKLPEGHRVQIVNGVGYTRNGMLLVIRLFREATYSINDYQIKEIEKEEIIKAVQDKQNILISGGTGTGKTSFLNMLSSYIDSEDRIITLEGVPELRIKHKNWASVYYSENNTGSGNKDISELLNVSLRMRPDRIILGELRKENCFVFIRAINTGHSGSLATIHSNSPEDALSAIKENVIMNGDAVEGAIGVLDNQLKRNIYGVIQLERRKAKVFGYFKRLNKI